MNDNTKGKVCTGCKEFKTFDFFGKDNAHKTGYKSQCKVCRNISAKKQRGTYDPNFRIDENGKTCTECKEYKGFDQYHFKVKSKGIYQSYCKSCGKEIQKQFYNNNKESILNQKKQYHQQNSEDIKLKRKLYYQEKKEEILEKIKQYRQDNLEKFKEKDRIYNLTNKEAIAQRRKKYLQSENGKNADFRGSMKRRSYKHKVSFRPIERTTILNRDNWECQMCGCKVHDRNTGHWNTPDKANIDHIIPISKGGNSEPDNLQVLCRTCNLSKKDKILNTI